MTTMREIAERCNVSLATVSKALNGYNDVGTDTAKAVKAMAKEMGYFPNAGARTLKTKRSNNLGVLFIDRMQSGLSHEYFSGILESFKREAEKGGFDITFISRDLGSRHMSYTEHCRYRGCDGVVVACVDFSDPEVLELAASEVPLVTIDHVFDNKSAVLSDNLSGMESLTRYILRRGHRDIAFIYGEQTNVTTKRLAGFYRACAAYNADIDESRVIASRYHDPKGAEEATVKLLGSRPLPTCVIYPDDFSYIGGRNALTRLGIKIPDDISVAGYDGINLTRLIEPKLTTLSQDAAGLGRAAARLLINAVNEPKTAVPEIVTMPGVLIEGETVAEV